MLYQSSAIKIISSGESFFNIKRITFAFLRFNYWSLILEILTYKWKDIMHHGDHVSAHVSVTWCSYNRSSAFHVPIYNYDQHSSWHCRQIISTAGLIDRGIFTRRCNFHEQFLIDLNICEARWSAMTDHNRLRQ